jgi:hypothetical protein
MNILYEDTLLSYSKIHNAFPQTLLIAKYLLVAKPLKVSGFNLEPGLKVGVLFFKILSYL